MRPAISTRIGTQKCESVATAASTLVNAFERSSRLLVGRGILPGSLAMLRTSDRTCKAPEEGCEN
jgi:hypothetical protein